MKNLSLILNIVLLLAVAYLFVDRFSSESEGAPVEEATEDEGKPLSVVYLNIDSLHENSVVFQKKKEELQQREAAAEASLRSKMKSFEREVIAFQQKVQGGTMTPKSAQEEQGRLAKKEQNLINQQERLATDLLKDTDEFNIAFNTEVRGYLDSLKAANDYDFVLVAGAGSQVLTANDNYDITNMVLEMLNKNAPAEAAVEE